VEAIEAGDEIRVGVNAYTDTEPSPLLSGNSSFVVVEARAEHEQVARLQAWRSARDSRAVAAALGALERTARDGGNLVPPSVTAAKAGVTTGEWAQTLRAVFGEYRAPTGVSQSTAPRNDERIMELRQDVDAASRRLGRRLTMLVAKPGLDGHSNGAEQIAIRARDAGMDVVYDGIRFTPEEIIAAARARAPHVVGLSVLSGSHVPLACDVIEGLRRAGLSNVKVVVGGIIPAGDEARLKSAGVAAVFGPRHYDLNAIMREIVSVASQPGEEST